MDGYIQPVNASPSVSVLHHRTVGIDPLVGAYGVRPCSSGAAPLVGAYGVRPSPGAASSLEVAFYIDGVSIQLIRFERSQPGITGLCDEVARFHPQKTVIKQYLKYHLPVYNALRSRGISVAVINLSRARALLPVGVGSAGSDAGLLARLAAAFDLYGPNLPDAFQRTTRQYLSQIDLDRQRLYQLRWRVAALLVAHDTPLHRVLAPDTGLFLMALQRLASGAGPDEVAALHPKPELRPVLSACINPDLPAAFRLTLAEAYESLLSLERRLQKFEDLLSAAMAPFAGQVALLATVPAVTPRLAWRLLAEFGDDFSGRYPGARAFCRAVGVAPLAQLPVPGSASAFKCHLVNIVREWVLTQHPGPLFAWYQSYLDHANQNLAVAALAHKIAEGLYIVHRKARPFDEYRFMRVKPPGKGLDLRAENVDQLGVAT